MKKRLIALLLVLMMTSSFIMSCNSKESNQGKTVSDENPTNEEVLAEETTEEEKYVFPELDCNGEDFTFLNVTTGWNFYTALVLESETGEILDDAIYSRNRTVEELFNVKLNEVAVDIGAVEAKVRTTVLAGESVYDAAYCPANNNGPLGGLITQNLFYDLNELSDLQFDKPWWNQTVTKEGVIGSDSKLYFASCDMNIMPLQGAWCVYFNEDMMRNLGLDLPYGLVKSGKWTLDEFQKYVKAGAQLNGDDDFATTKAAWNPSGASVYGYTSYEGGTTALLVGTGERFISRDSSGMPYLSIETDRFYNVCDRIANITMTKGEYQNANDAPFHYESIFGAGRALMMIGELKAADVLRDMDNTFGIVPIPKYDENQSQYYSSLARQMPLLVVPVTNNDIKRTGVIIDAMAYLSAKDVTPIFFDVTMSQKRLRNEESIDMLQIVKDSVLFDIGVLYGWSSDLTGSVRDAIDKGNSSVASIIEKGKDKVQANIDKTMELLD